MQDFPVIIPLWDVWRVVESDRVSPLTTAASADDDQWDKSDGELKSEREEGMAEILQVVVILTDKAVFVFFYIPALVQLKISYPGTYDAHYASWCIALVMNSNVGYSICRYALYTYLFFSWHNVLYTVPTSLILWRYILLKITWKTHKFHSISQKNFMYVQTRQEKNPAHVWKVCSLYDHLQNEFWQL